MNPYLIEGPALISFSGGRTSAYMLKRIIDAHGGVLPSNVHVVFANTGKERPETLDFVWQCGMEWNVDVVWLEYTGVSNGTKVPASYTHWIRVAYETASRNGKPFEDLIAKRSYLPNPIMRMCTQEMKIWPMTGYMLSLGYTEWVNVIGLRRDEPRRVAKRKNANNKEKYYDSVMPLFDDGVTERDVLDFWKGQHFDLKLKSYQGNCDLCYLKGFGKLIHIIEENPSLADWWIEQEVKIGNLFRADRPSYAKMKAFVQQQGRLFEPLDDDTIPCTCTD